MLGFYLFSGFLTTRFRIIRQAFLCSCCAAGNFCMAWIAISPAPASMARDAWSGDLRDSTLMIDITCKPDPSYRFQPSYHSQSMHENQYNKQYSRCLLRSQLVTEVAHSNKVYLSFFLGQIDESKYTGRCNIEEYKNSWIVCQLTDSSRSMKESKSRFHTKNMKVAHYTSCITDGSLANLAHSLISLSMPPFSTMVLLLWSLPANCL